jgi:hypothetical protein
MATHTTSAIRGLGAGLGAVLVSASIAVAQIPPGGLPARVTVVSPPVSEAMFSSVDHGKTAKPSDDRYARTSWRVIEETGNCCENYVTINAQGQLFDFGGTYIYVSNDRGLTWLRVEPLTPLVNGEGAIVAAPGGDILGIGWDPYSGDHLQAFKYEGTTGQWLFSEMPLHQPFYDREWIAVVPGPITIGGQTHEYVAFVKGATPWKEVWFYSTDGINYVDVTSKAAEQTLTGAAASGALPTGTGAINDWAQANSNGAMYNLGGGDLLAEGDLLTTWSLFDGQTFSWSAYADPAIGPVGRYQVDSAGRIHNVVPSTNGNSFDYRMSANGGLSWQSTTVELPRYHSFEEWDFRANLAAGVAAVAVHAQDRLDGNDQDLAYKFDISGTAPRLVRSYTLGLGDVNSEAGVGNDVRMDFETIGIFPDGRIVLSFIDSTTTRPGRTGGDSIAPALAIELSTEVGRKIPVTQTTTAQLGTPYATFTFDAGDEGWTTGGTGTWVRQSPGAAADGSDDPAGSAWTVPAQAYINMMNASVTSPAVATDAGPAVVQFQFKMDIEPGFDFLLAEWSADGANWLPLGDFTGQNAGYPGWQTVTAGIESPGGDIFVRFRLESDQLCSGLETVWCGVPYQGVAVDNVIIGRQASSR